MKTSEKGIAFIAALEGVVTRAYRDVAGVWTIGVGHTAAAGPPKPVPGMTITRDEAFRILARDLPRYEARVRAALGTTAQEIFDGAASFDFNTGAIDRASWVKELRALRPDAARAGLMRWTKARGRTIAGLVRRREAEARLIFEGRYGAAEAAEPAAAEVRGVQRQLATLGFDPGAIDGIAGAKTRAAILAYQKSHPDLVADGIAGPATRGSLDRDILARRRIGETAGAALGAGATAAVGAAGSGTGDPILAAAVVGFGVLLILGVFFALRYRGDLKRRLSPRKGH